MLSFPRGQGSSPILRNWRCADYSASVREMEQTHHKWCGILCPKGSKSPSAWASLIQVYPLKDRLRSGVSAPVPWQGWSKIVICWGVHYSWTCKLWFHMNWIGSPTLQDRAGDRERVAPHVPLRKVKEAKNSKFELGLLDCYVCQGHGREHT